MTYYRVDSSHTFHMDKCDSLFLFLFLKNFFPLHMDFTRRKVDQKMSTLRRKNTNLTSRITILFSWLIFYNVFWLFLWVHLLFNVVLRISRRRYQVRSFNLKPLYEIYTMKILLLERVFYYYRYFSIGKTKEVIT